MLTNHDKGSVYKEVRLVKFDFSSTNYKLKVTGWRLSIEKKADALFPAVCDRARATAGVDAATAQLEYQDPEVLARANLESESESEGENHDESKGQDESKSQDEEDSAAEHRENICKKSSGTADDHDDGGESDEDDKDIGGEDIGGKEDEDNSTNSKVNLGSGTIGDGYDSDDNRHDETETEKEDQDHAEGSVLTEMESSSDLAELEAVPTPMPPRGRKKGVRGGC